MAFSLFPAFYDRPTHIKFAYQEDDEVIELFLRQHWTTNLSWIFALCLGMLLPLLFPLIPKEFFVSLNIEVPLDIRISALVLWYLLILAYAIGKFFSWYFNIFIVTNRHIIDVDFHNLMNRHTTEVKIEDVQSPRSQIKGILGSLFNFGDVKIETAAKTLHLDFVSVPKPDLVVDRIQDLHEFKKGGGDAS